MPVKELVAEVGLHHTAVRQHLSVLRDAGLLVESTERSKRPGRPRLVYRTSVDAATRWAGPAPYEQLSMMVLQMVDTGADPRQIGRTAGVAAADRVGQTGPEPSDSVVRELTRLGFDPQCRVDDGGVEVVLQHCPMAAAAGRWPEIVCELHHGIVEAMAESLGAGAVRGFSPAEAHRGGCSFWLDTPHD